MGVIGQLMQERNMTKKQLADALQTSKSYITRLFTADRLLTLTLFWGEFTSCCLSGGYNGRIAKLGEASPKRCKFVVMFVHKKLKTGQEQRA
ncbi:XRE family transcriptional regulator [Sphingobacteriales bacterium UPWRP_1]|nr:hypothetical protein BVG80_11985 [Sphingobacteriales bacterium TSM_CSM]PSJ77942.1 XRE family transcriptional regulator [Sphingobacteriales bacterium UPWRP_1]